MKYVPKTKPFKHQSRATVRALRHRNYAIFAEPRTGKSKMALDYAGVLALKGEVKRVLIIAPRISLDVWESEIRKHFPYWCHVEDFEREWYEIAKDKLVFEDFQVQFFLAGREETFRRVNGERPKQKILEQWNPDVIVFDESHEYKRAGGRGAQDAWRMVRRLRKRRAPSGLPYVLLLTGTPTPKGWVDVFAQFRIMDEDIFGTAKEDFEDEYVIRGTGRRKWVILGYKNEKRLERKVRENSISISEEEAGLAKKMFFQHFKYELPPQAYKMYLEMAENFLVEWEGGLIDAKNAGVKRLRLLQIAGGFTTDGDEIHGAGLARIKAYLALLLEQEESVVVYARFVPEVLACHELIRGLGYRGHLVYGATSRADRRRAVDSLASRPTVPTAVVFQHQAGSRSIDLSGAAETCYYSAPDGWVDYRQTLGRTRGPNQTRAVRYSHFSARGTVAVSVIRALAKKETQHDYMMRNPRGYLLGL